MTEIAPTSVQTPPKLPPWKDLAPKQKELMKISRWKTGHKKFIGVFGTRISGKTYACENVVCDHLWRTKNARFLVLVRTQGAGTTSGIWNLLTEVVLPSWMEADGIDPEHPEVHMQWAEKGEPRANVSKKMIAAVTNMHGGVSKLELDSLDDEREVEEKFKNRYYTGVLWCEAGEFKSEKTLTTLIMALRGIGYQEDDFIMMVDANPPDEGEDHFLFKYFYELRLNPNPSLEQRAIKECFITTEWTMDDNTHISENEKAYTKGLYMNDPELYDRYVRGLWKRATRDAIFSDIFKVAIHVAGNKDEILIPTENCTELMTSHDPGFKNPCLYVIEQVDYEVPYTTREGKPAVKTVSKFLALDELAYIGVPKQVSEFTAEVLDLMDKYEQELGQELIWTHYSDRSALDTNESISNRSVADEMYAVSDGRIRLIGVEKKGKSIEAGVRLTRKLLAEQRILISYARCPKLIQAFQNLAWKKVNGAVQVGKMPDRSDYKHPWDAFRYMLEYRCWGELQAMTKSIRKRTGGSRGLITVPL